MHIENGHHNKFAWLLPAIILLVGWGCATDGSLDKQQAGATIGSIVGSVIGMELGDDDGLATLGGAVLGAFIGSEIGQYLDEKDKQAQAQATFEVVSGPNEGDTVTWENQDSGNSGKVSAGPMVDEVITVPVSDVGGLIPIGATYRALNNAGIRADPNTDSRVVGILNQGETFEAVSKVENANWILAARGDQTLGFVSGDLVEPDTGIESTPAADQTEQAVTLTRQCRYLIHTDNLSDGREARKEVEYCKSLDGKWAVQSERMVTLSGQCRNVIRTVTLSDGREAREEVKFCKLFDGQWAAA